MPTSVSPNLTIDFSRLAPPDVVETVDFELILQDLKNALLQRNPLLLQAVQLEQSPTSIILEVEAFAETLVRERINAAARAVMLPSSLGKDLDNLAGLYNVARLQGELDPAFRARIQLAPEAFTTCGSTGAYVYHAKTADPTILDATATQVSPGRVRVTVMNSGSDPTATQDQLDNVTARLLLPEIKPLTDDFLVTSVQVKATPIVATITLYPGPSASVVMRDINANLAALTKRIAAIGFDLTRAALFAAMTVEGVQNVVLTSPAQDVVVDDTQCVQITSVTLTPALARMN